jgi:hypothetical protein
MAMAAASPVGSDVVVLADAYGFGLSVEQARANAASAGAHHDLRSLEFVERFGYDGWSMWNSHMWRLRRVWESLATSLDESKPIAVRLAELAILRTYLDDEMYFGRKLPPPIPHYLN